MKPYIDTYTELKSAVSNDPPSLDGRHMGFDELAVEVALSRAKFPGNRFMLAALIEEAGELAEAHVIGNQEAVKLEALQVACVAVRIYTEGDATTYRLDGLISMVAALGNVARNLLQRGSTETRRSLARHLGLVADRVARDGDATFADAADVETRP